MDDYVAFTLLSSLRSINAFNLHNNAVIILCHYHSLFAVEDPWGPLRG